MPALSNRSKYFILLAVAGLIGGVIFLFSSKPGGHERTPFVSPVIPILGTVPDFSFTNQTGESVTKNNLLGKIWVADFIFTRCAGPCPMITARMKTLAEKFRDNENVRFVSFSVDPVFDTPEVLSKYAAKYDADPARWHFLTGDKDEIYELSERYFHLGVGDIPAEDREALDQAIRHSTRFALVDSEGKIRGYYDSESWSSIEKIIAEIKLI